MKFPTLQYLVLEGETPWEARRKHREKMRRIREKTLQQYGIDSSSNNAKL